LIFFITFVVIFVTLVVQGLSLPPLIRKLGIKPRNDDRKEEMELQLLMQIVHWIISTTTFPFKWMKNLKNS